jgi:RNA polymerase sigma-70 factor (ECF subfamily)
MSLLPDHTPSALPATETALASPVALSVGDHAAHVRQLFEQHNRALVGFLSARLNSVQEARDVAQEAYARLLQIDQPGAVSFLRAYLFQIAANLAIDRLRQRRVREQGTPTAFFEALLTQASPERIVLADQQLAVLAAALEELPDKCREAFAQHYLADQSFREIAASMGIGHRMVQKYVARALAHCRLRMAEPRDAAPVARVRS